VTRDAEGMRSVNWVTGMLLTPEHFRAQDRYIEDSFGWILRYCVPGAGLVGGGVRLRKGEMGQGRFDPKLEIEDDGKAVRLAVLQARGITPNGTPVEITEAAPLRTTVAKDTLAGATELLVSLVATDGKSEDPNSVGADPANPSLPAWARPAHEIALGVAADLVPQALVVGRIRRASATLNFELDPRFIPACAMVLAHSELHAAWQKMHAELVQIAGGFSALHRTVAGYVDKVARRGIDTRADMDILSFIERAVMALDTCAYETQDPSQSPQSLFQQIERAGRRAALALDLSPSTRDFIGTLSGADAGYGALLEEERQLLSAGREIDSREDLRDALERAEETVGRLRRLAGALQGKYLDYRINTALDGLRFLLDRDGEEFYVSVARPTHPQREGDVLTFVFSGLELPGNREYRIVLLGDPESSSHWQIGEQVNLSVYLNPEAGGRSPLSDRVPCEIAGQRNFGMNFSPPADVGSVSSLRVTAQPAQRVRGAVLYQRQLGLATAGAAPVRPAAKRAPPPQPSPPPASTPQPPTAPKIRIRKRPPG